MSMNIYITAVRNIWFNHKDGTVGSGTQVVDHFDAIQTPTRVTYEILESSNPAQTYIDWNKGLGCDEEFPIYADDDIFCQGEPIGVSIYNRYEEHVEEFQEWLLRVEAEGYTVKYEAI